MKPYNVFIALAIILNIQFAQAEQENTPMKPSDTLLTKNDNAGNRVGKSITIQLQPVGLSTIGANESLLILGYHITANDVLELEAGAGRSDFQLKWDGQSEDKKVLKGESVGIHYKRFLGNTFYFKTGLDYRGIKYQDEITSSDYAHIEGTSGVASLLIGNQWQWQNLTLGCDWVGLGVPFATIVSSQYGASSDAIESAKKKHLEDAFTQGLRFYIGATF